MNLKGNRSLKRIQSLSNASNHGPFTIKKPPPGMKSPTDKRKTLPRSKSTVIVTKEPSEQDITLLSDENPPGYGDELITLNDCCFHLICPDALPKLDPNVDSVEKEEFTKRANGSICVSYTKYTVILNVSKSLGFKLVKDMKLGNILWIDTIPGVEVYKSMKRFQQINHFPGMIEICWKVLLSRNLNRMLKLYPSEYDIFPKTWVFPADLGAAIAYSKEHKNKTFILKPSQCAQGRGIWLTNDLSTITPTDRMICQVYISKPLLIDGYKFDLRVYTLITCVDPLRIFVYNEGLARFATSRYREPNSANATDLFMHLTNYSLNKNSSEFSKCEKMGSKRKFRTINKLLSNKGYDIVQLWENIDDIIIKTILSAWPMLRHNYHACFPTHDKIQACFEILGFDILVDSKLKPYILEVNHSPSFHMIGSVDHEVKQALIKDTLTLVGTMLADKQEIIREDRNRVRRRLLKKSTVPVQVEQKRNNDNNTNTNEANSNDKPTETVSTENTLSPLTQQIAWEESHLGDFRRIMPPTKGEVNKYCQFFDLQNQASVYSETAASKLREEVTKELRLELKMEQDKEWFKWLVRRV